MTATITFYGGAGTVTGANFLLEYDGHRVLIDCGAREREALCVPENDADFAYDPASIEALIVTHAHQDHIGRIPRLVRDGFHGKVISTPATKELSAIMFDDAIKVMQQESKRYGCPLIYEPEDTERAISLWRTHEYHESFEIGDASIGFLDAGHILGSALVKFTRGGKSIIFTGDLGNSPEPLLRDTESPEGTSFLVMESVYGDRVHEERDERRDLLRRAIEGARENGGTLLIPSFSLERTQILLYEIDGMIARKEMRPIDVYLDAPLAERVTGVYEKHTKDLNDTAQKSFEHGGNPFEFTGLSVIKNVKESSDIHNEPDPKVIIAGAGMSSGGRIRAHERRYLPDSKASVLLVGYQAPGSLGRRIQDGEKRVSIDGEEVTVRAKVSTLTGYSGHADRDQLMQFVEKTHETLVRAFIVMGEPKASAFLAQRLRDFYGVDAQVPSAGEKVTIEW